MKWRTEETTRTHNVILDYTRGDTFIRASVSAVVGSALLDMKQIDEVIMMLQSAKEKIRRYGSQGGSGAAIERDPKGPDVLRGLDP